MEKSLRAREFHDGFVNFLHATLLVYNKVTNEFKILNKFANLVVPLKHVSLVEKVVCLSNTIRKLENILPKTSRAEIKPLEAAMPKTSIPDKDRSSFVILTPPLFSMVALAMPESPPRT